MTLITTLLADLERQYYFLGLKDKSPTLLSLFLSFLSPRFMPVVLFRLSHFCFEYKLSILAKIFSLINFLLFGIEIAVQCDIGKGLFFPHTVGTVIGALRIGENALIYQGVTLGAKSVDFSYSSDSRPVVGDNVSIGSGAKVLGGIKVGDGVTIGANSVVVKDVMDHVVVAGVPAKVIRHLSQEECAV